MAPYQYKYLEESIKTIVSRNVTINEEEKKRCNNILKQIFDIVESEMKKDNAFYALFRQKQYVGSYYENLKIDVPDEFDIDFELNVPSYIGVLEVCSSEEPGFCQLKLHGNPLVPSDPRKAEAQKEVKKWTDPEGFISRSKVNRWMQRVVDKALTEYSKKHTEKTFKFERSRSGPAETLFVTLNTRPNLRLSLDLVPVFVFGSWPRKLENLREWSPEMKEQRWYAVPKSKSSDRDFRLSFWHQEKHLLCGTYQMKPILKLMKKLRDDKTWKGISSYCIKTLFLWKTAANGKDYWRRGLGVIFIEMLTALKTFLLEEKALPFFWVKECDLLSQLHPAEKEGVGRFLRDMIRKIETKLDEQDFVLQYFNLKDRSVTSEVDPDELVSLDTPLSSRSVDQNSTVVQPQQQNNNLTRMAMTFGAATILAVGLYRAFNENSRS